MTADLLTRLNERDRRVPKARDRHRAAFLALRDEIQHALEAGRNAKRIWELLKEEGKNECSYQAFNSHVKLFIKETKQSTSSVVVRNTKNTTNTTASIPHKPTTEPAPIKGFHHDPTALTLDDLL